MDGERMNVSDDESIPPNRVNHAIIGTVGTVELKSQEEITGQDEAQFKVKVPKYDENVSLMGVESDSVVELPSDGSDETIKTEKPPFIPSKPTGESELAETEPETEVEPEKEAIEMEQPVETEPETEVEPEKETIEMEQPVETEPETDLEKEVEKLEEPIKEPILEAPLETEPETDQEKENIEVENEKEEEPVEIDQPMEIKEEVEMKEPGQIEEEVMETPSQPDKNEIEQPIETEIEKTPEVIETPETEVIEPIEADAIEPELAQLSSSPEPGLK